MYKYFIVYDRVIDCGKSDSDPGFDTRTAGKMG
jgi:hypothetical protein